MGWFGKKRQAEAEEIRVLRSDARVDDIAALTRLLEQLPEADGLAAHLSGNFFARAWEKNAGRDYWVLSDGTHAACFTLCGLNLKQAAAVRVRWDALANRLTLTERVIAELVSAETRQIVQTISFVSSEHAALLEPTSTQPIV
jgi:hypothetical protein